MLRLIHDSDAHEYEPLPHYGWEERPLTIPIDIEEAATAIHLAKGVITTASQLLKVGETRLRRVIRNHPRLQRIADEHLAVLNDKAIAEVASAFDSPDDRRREWATARVLASRLGKDNPLAPVPSSAQSGSLEVNPADRTITIHWGAAPATPALEGPDEDPSPDEPPDAA
jgi:hypothetical protein